MKPSERVLKWTKFFNEETRKENSSLENALSAIIQVMDEEYEKNEHENNEHEHEGSIIFPNGQLLCDKCGQFFDNL